MISITLDSSVTQKAFTDLVYDLNVRLDSAQVTKDEFGNETMSAVAWTTADLSDVSATPVSTSGEPTTIASITWTAYPTT